MRIAQVAPLVESVPPKLYGGTERVVSYLTEELVRQGHEVTLFASGDSRTQARLIAAWPEALRLSGCCDPLAPHVLLLERVFERRHEFDIIHFHCSSYLHFPNCRRHSCRHVTTMHGRLDLPEIHPLFREYCDMPLISISDDQRAPMPWARWAATVYHGLPLELHRFRRERGKYLAFLGRISPEKRVDRAIRIARDAGMPLKIAAKVDAADKAYYHEKIEPLLCEFRGLVEFIGEVGGRDKDEFLGNAYALLFPIDWPEPFGLVMIEAMACGTPVIGWRNGSVPEVLDEGVTGFIVDSHEQAVAAVGRVSELSRRKCRDVFERRFSVARMAEDHLRLYTRLLEAARTSRKKRSADALAAARRAIAKDMRRDAAAKIGSLRRKQPIA